MEYKFIAIEGNIGAGKTSLTKKLAADFGARIILEEFENNPFLPKFYKNPDQHAFSLELFFLAERYNQLKKILSAPDLFENLTVADYFINKSLIFARATLGQDEYDLFHKLYHIMYSSLPKPELLVYLYVNIDNLQRNIAKRGREYEQNIQAEYLFKIQENYIDFLKKQTDFRVLLIDCNAIDFVNRKEDYDRVVAGIKKPYEKGINRLLL